MKRQYFIQLLVVIMLIVVGSSLSAQDELIGTIKYSKVTKFDFEKRDDPRWNEFIASLPSEVSSAYILYFKGDFALYSENPLEQKELSREARRAMHMKSWGKAPKANLNKVYYNLEKSNIIEQKEFMTRYFIIEGDIETPAWKIAQEKRKILDYVCMSAEMEIDSQIVKAWFAPQIPISVGPDQYYGLPGLILAVEKNGETILLASSIEKSLPSEDVIIKPNEGKKVTNEELEAIMVEKTEEARKAREARMKAHGKGRGHGRGRGPH